MYAEITARDIGSRGAGKSMWVNDSDFKIALSRKAPEHLDSPPWHLEIKANSESDKGGIPGKIVERELELALTPRDVVKIVQFALDHELITLPRVKATNGRK